MKKIITSVFLIILGLHALAQDWSTTLNVGIPNNLFGTTANVPINIYTNNIQRARFTTGNSLNSLVGNTGDGLRIFDPAPGGIGHLDLFTSGNVGGNETHIVWGSSGQVSGQNNRFEFLAKAANGFWFDLINSNQYYKLATNATVHAFVGSNRYWRFGDQTELANISANRRLEAVDLNPQFRLQYGGSNSSSGPFTDFLSNSNGNLQIMPSGQRVGINLTTNPTSTLDVNGDLRIRNVQTATPNSILIGVNASSPSDVNVRRLAFTGNAGQVLLGNGTWGTIPPSTPPLANNGVSRNLIIPNSPYQLGDGYNILPFNTSTPLTSNRQVRLAGRNFVFSGTGRVAIGLSWPNLPTEVLDVNGNARFRNIPSQGGNYILLGLQNSGPDDVELSKLQFPGVTNQYLAGDGTWVTIPDNSPIAACSDPSPTAGALTTDSKMNLNNFNFYFTKSDQLNKNMIGIGYNCGIVLPGKLAVRQLYPVTVSAGTTAGHFYNSDIANVVNLSFIGAYGSADGHHPVGLRSRNIGGSFYAESADINIGVLANSTAGNMSTSNNMGGNLIATFGGVAQGLVAQGSTGINRSIGVSGVGTSPSTPSLFENIGGQFTGAFCSATNYGVKASGTGGNTAIGVYGTASGGSTNWAGYFDGDVYISGWYGPSDQNLKENVVSLEHADSLLNLLNPVSFNYRINDYPQLNLQNGTQTGLIAQQVESILPNIVKENTSPASYDSLGNVLYPTLTYKTVDYTKLIPVLISGHKEQAQEMLTKDSIINSLITENATQQATIEDLNNRLTQLENCLSGILPLLCQLNQSAIQANTPTAQEEVRKNLNITLSNRTTIIIDQNVPNPFAEQTTINFSIPESVRKAQIHFYDGYGKLIQSIEINERGLGSITVFGSDLSSGVYTYTLVADGQTVASKKMMKQ